MLTLVERILFVLAFLASVGLTLRGFGHVLRVLMRPLPEGERPSGRWWWVDALDRLIRGPLGGRKPRWEKALEMVFLQIPVFRARFFTSLFHAFIFYAFLVYGLVNLQDVIRGYVADFSLFGATPAQRIFELSADVLSVLALMGVLYFLLRRFVFGDPRLDYREDVPLHPAVRKGIPRDSLIVAGFIFFHVGGRLLSEAAHLALHANGETWMPFAAALAQSLAGLSPGALVLIHHAAWWLALGLILAFLPYFPYSKHIHLFFAPVKWAYRLDLPAIGYLEKLDLENETAEQFGAARIEHLHPARVLDLYACIMCNRCQEVCPAYATGKPLSPAALIINMRYEVNTTLNRVALGEPTPPLMDYAINEDALWACTTCGACVEICPVGNEPMHTILQIRQDRVLMESQFPSQFSTMMTGIERLANPWNVHWSERKKWTEGLSVPTVEQNPNFEVLLWVGCMASTDDRAKRIARSLVKIFEAAGVNYAVLGEHERCTGDPARRAGNEYLFQMRATENVETLNRFGVKRIVTLCPHCYNTLKNEYPDFGGHYEVMHHSQFLEELLKSGRLKVKTRLAERVTFHDPCYLGRHNGEYEAPRFVLRALTERVAEMERSRNRSFCCGAGGAQMFKEDLRGTKAINVERTEEALKTGADVIATGCPFCQRMLTDGVNSLKAKVQVKDLAEILAEALEA